MEGVGGGGKCGGGEGVGEGGKCEEDVREEGEWRGRGKCEK